MGQLFSGRCWREFRTALGSRSNHICWYCERQCYSGDEPGGRAPTVDHFRPISRFPDLVYDWANWVFSCLRCNEVKDNKWPDSGLVDPCAAAISHRPENSFDYDILTGDLVPKRNLSQEAERRAWDTIDELGLNKIDVKIHRMELVQEFFNSVASLSRGERGAYIDSRTKAAIEHLGTIRLFAAQLKQSGRI